MRKRLRTGWLAIFALSVSGCATVGPVPVCPQLPPVPASLMRLPTTEQTVRRELLRPLPQPTRKSADSKTR